MLDEAIAVARAGMVLGLLLGHRYDEVGDRAFLREAGTRPFSTVPSG
ncbi:hypothetical protein [Actinomadura sp. NEAU-AAG7]|nr:hypothetical protein [Actinomadura sp. NEAU-AAG7]MBT2208895.1 hypothetical protein [Actinomadura sp. NEAU-AAG7]